MLSILQAVGVVLALVIVVTVIKKTGKNAPALSRKAGKAVAQIGTDTLEVTKEFREGLKEGRAAMKEAFTAPSDDKPPKKK